MKTLWLRSYSVRNADGTRTRTRTRCCSITSIMFGISITMDGSSENLKVARKKTAIEYEYRSAEYQYVENPLLRSYSVRNADGTRHRTRCCSITSIMFGISITMDGSSENLKVARKKNSHRVRVPLR